MINENYRCSWSDDKLAYIRFYTRFVDDINDDVHYFIDTETGRCCDEGYTRADLIIHTDDKKMTDKVMNFVCKRYGCEMVGKEMQAERPEQLLQAMMAVYAWIDFKEAKL